MRQIQQSSLVSSHESDKTDTNECLIDTPIFSSKTVDNISISWHSHLRSVPDGPVLIIGQEFLDTFPIHQFQKSADGWKEVLVDIDNSSDSKLNFRFVLSPKITPAAHLMIPQRMKLDSATATAKLNFPAANTLTSKNPFVAGATVQGALDSANNRQIEKKKASVTVATEGLEVSPLALAVVEDISQRINRSGGCALLIDYGGREGTGVMR